MIQIISHYQIMFVAVLFTFCCCYVPDINVNGPCVLVLWLVRYNVLVLWLVGYDGLEVQCWKRPQLPRPRVHSEVGRIGASQDLIVNLWICIKYKYLKT